MPSAPTAPGKGSAKDNGQMEYDNRIETGEQEIENVDGSEEDTRWRNEDNGWRAKWEQEVHWDDQPFEWNINKEDKTVKFKWSWDD